MQSTAKRPRFLRLSYFVWLILPAIGIVVWRVCGLPAIVWSYTFLDNGARNDPFADRAYVSCTYVSSYGVQTVPATDGACPAIRFLKAGQ